MAPERASLVDRRARGARIEALAREFLQRHGLLPIVANANYRFGELDLVMRDGISVVFVEVRYRNTARFGGGAASVDASKRRKIVRAASAFLSAHRAFANAPCRFDVIEAAGDADAPDFTWLRDAFRADDI